MRQRKYDYELIVQVRGGASPWEDIETVQTDSTYYYNLDYNGTESRGSYKSAAKTARYLTHESAIAYKRGNYIFRTIRRRTKKGAAA